MLSKEEREAIQGSGSSFFPDGTYSVYVVSVDWLPPRGTGELVDTLQITLDVQVGQSRVVRHRDRLRIRSKDPAPKEISMSRLKTLFDSAGIDVMTQDEKELEHRELRAVFKTRPWKDRKIQGVERYLCPPTEKAVASVPEFLRK
jgi:hypothetical protein